MSVIDNEAKLVSFNSHIFIVKSMDPRPGIIKYNNDRGQEGGRKWEHASSTIRYTPDTHFVECL